MCGKTDSNHIDHSNDDSDYHHDSASRKSTIDGNVLNMAISQTCVLLYCNTPGKCGILEGITGVYSYSHYIILEALRRTMEEEQLIKKNDYANAKSSTNLSPLCSSSSSSSSSILRYMEVLKNWGERQETVEKLKQLEINDDEAILTIGTMALTIGTMAHSAMWSAKPMEIKYNNGISSNKEEIKQQQLLLPRTIQNPKCHAGGQHIGNLEMKKEFINTLSIDSSLLAQLYTSPMNAFMNLHNEDNDSENNELEKYIRHEAAYLSKEFLSSITSVVDS